MSQDSLPRLWRGRRRLWFTGLALTGVGQAAAATASALLTPRLLSVQGRDHQVMLGAGLVMVCLLLGLLRVAERVLGEKVGQDYVHEIRMHLVRAALAGRGASVGVTVARTTNDLTSVRNWVVLGIVPLLVGVPMLVGCAIALSILSPVLGLAVAVPVLLLAVSLWLLAPALRERAARLRKRRGRLAGAITDAVHASDMIVVAGGLEREVRRLADESREVAGRAVSRAVLSGWVRGSAASLGTLTMVVVGACGAMAGLDAATIAAAFVIVGMLSTPVSDLGRVSEYRQSFRVAQRILGPEVERSRQIRRRERAVQRQVDRRGARPLAGGVHLADLELRGVRVAELVAEPGEVVVPRSADPALVRELFGVLTHPERQPSAWLRVAGHDLGTLPARERRRLISHAAAGQSVGRGSIARAVRYRDPEGDHDAAELLHMVGLERDVAALPKGEHTALRRGGEPLDEQQRARLHLARAWCGGPPLVLLERIDEALDAEGRELLARELRNQSGVTLLWSDRAAELAPDHRVWDLGADPTRPCLPRRRGVVNA